MLSPSAPLMFDARRRRAGRSVWATLTAALLAGLAFAAAVLVQRPTQAGPPPQAIAPASATQSSSGDNFLEPTPPKVLGALAPAGGFSSPSPSVESNPTPTHSHKHKSHRPVPPPPPSCDGRSNFNPQANETGPISSITRGLSDQLPAPAGGDGGVVTELSCAVASLGL